MLKSTLNVFINTLIFLFEILLLALGAYRIGSGIILQIILGCVLVFVAFMMIDSNDVIMRKL